MQLRSVLLRFGADLSGAVMPLVIILLPLMLLVGGFATDISLINAQKRYTQSQADLAAQSAAAFLPDPQRVRSAARRVVQANPRYGNLVLEDGDIRLGTWDGNRFTAAADQTSGTGVNAVQVVVPSPFRPLLLGPVLRSGQVVVTREAIGAQSGGGALFMLRNRLVGLDTEQSALHALLGPLGLGLTLNALSYEGLANTRVQINDLLGLVTAGVAAEALTFDDVLKLPVAVPELLKGLVKLGALPKSAVPIYFPSPNSITFQEIMDMSPGLLRLRAGDILPDVSLSALDLLTLLAQLKSRQTERLGAGLDVDINDLLPGVPVINRLLNVTVKAGLIRPPVWVLAQTTDNPARVAKVEQTGVTVEASTLSLLDLKLQTGVASAEAVLTSLNCAAASPTDIAAVFSVTTAPVTIDLRLSLLKISDAMSERAMAPIALSGQVQQVSITKAQMGQAVQISRPLAPTLLVNGLTSLLRVIRDDIESEEKRCKGLLGAALCPLSGLVTGVVGGVLGLLATLLDGVNDILLKPLLLDRLVAQIQALVGLAVAEAELVLADTVCGGGLVR